MIVKKIKRTSFVKTKAQQIADLVDYIRNSSSKNVSEKVAYSDGKNFLSDTHNGQKLEMIKLAQVSVRSKMPVAHWLFSWQENEQPTHAQVDEVVDMFLQGMGLEGHQTIFALHQDRANFHLHIAVNRMNETTGKVVLPHNGWDIKVGHRILAQIERKQGWASTPNARYKMLENGEIVHNRPTYFKVVNPSPKACNFERATGEKSAQRIAQEGGYDLISKAKSWAELHTKLAQVGLRFEKKGSGAIIFVGDIAIKASSLHRSFSMGKLCKCLGEFEAGAYPEQKQALPPEPVSPINNAEWQEYQKQRNAPRQAHPIKKRNQDIAEVKANIKQRRAYAYDKLKGEDPIFSRIASRLLYIKQLDELETIHEAYKQQPKVSYACPDFATWLHGQGLHVQANRWRHRKKLEEQSRKPPPQPPLPPTSVELQAFERYAKAIDAQRYRVTCVKLKKDGTKQGFVLDKRNGASKGFTVEEMPHNMPQMQRIHMTMENIYYTPLSDDKHHILIDDMTAESVERLRKDGFIPAVILESSPKNYQWILTINKLDSLPLSKWGHQAANQLTAELNKKYGDPKLSGCIHPHRAPGFANFKQEHKTAEGGYPRVQLIFAEKQECGHGSKAFLTARHIAKQLEEQEKQRKAQTHAPQRPQFSQTSATTAYYLHYDNVRQHMPIEDYSRLDAMIALRMRATGHSPQTVIDAIADCAPSIRTKEGRNWKKYAERTAAYAFGVAGDIALERYEKIIRHMENKNQRRDNFQQFQLRT